MMVFLILILSEGFKSSMLNLPQELHAVLLQAELLLKLINLCSELHDPEIYTLTRLRELGV